MEVLCKAGKLIISDRSIQVVAPFNKIVWSVQRQAIMGVSLKRGVFMSDVLFQASGSVFKADGVANKKAQEIVKLFS